jgi:tetratricopeptide (TPR) repeat protein
VTQADRFPNQTAWTVILEAQDAASPERRARARKALEKREEAIADVEQALRLDPGNSRAAELLKELKP